MIAIFGANGHAKVIADILLSRGNKNFIFVDKKSGTINFNQNAFNIIEEEKCANQFDEFILGMGFCHNAVRKKIHTHYSNSKKLAPALIHQTAIIASHTNIANGTCVMAGAIINTHSTIGKNCVINTGAIVEHDCQIGENTFINPGAILAGKVTVGENCVIGIGASIRDGVTIASNVFVGAGAYVSKDITESGLYTGISAKRTGDYSL